MQSISALLVISAMASAVLGIVCHLGRVYCGHPLSRHGQIDMFFFSLVCLSDRGSPILSGLFTTAKVTLN